MGTLPTGNVTFLFTDIEGSTKLAQEYPDEMSSLLARHNEILSQAFEGNNGFVFRTVGDAYCVAFHRPEDAISAALDAQRLLNQEAWSPAPIKVRMGIHTGAAQIEGGSDYSGYSTLALVNRIMSAGHGGQILISKTVHEVFSNNFPDEIYLVDMGEHNLKDVFQPQHLYLLGAPDLPFEFPPLKTQKTVNHNLPVKLTSFIGREREREVIKTRLEDTRLLTLIGPGGTGKTRLSIQSGGELLPTFQDGVWLVELAPITDPGLIPQAIASVFGVRESPDRPLIEIIKDYLRAKSSLVILDNCEHLIEACAIIAEILIQACPNLKIIASSREALGISGEITYRVPSLLLPDLTRVTRQALLEYESVQLFVDRASLASPKFQLTDRNAFSVAQICHRLDGIPLALELAAARTRVLTVEQIAERLDDRFRLLTGGSRTALPRQQTLRALIDWSYDLLSDTEKALFRRLAVFIGGWTLEAAEAVCSGDGVDQYEVLDLLTQLVDKSLAHTDEGDGVIRYLRLETIRQYAREKLLASDETVRVRHRHLDYYVNWAALQDESYINPQQEQVIRKVGLEYGNIRSALSWAVEGHLEKAMILVSSASITWPLIMLGRITEARDWFEQINSKFESLSPLEQEANTGLASLRARVLNRYSQVLMNLGDHEASRSVVEESIKISRKSQDLQTLSEALGSLGHCALYAGDPDAALEAALEGIRICEREGFLKELIWANDAMVHIYNLLGDKAEVRNYRERGSKILALAGVPIDPVDTEFDRALETINQQDFDRGVKHMDAAVEIMEANKDKYRLTSTQSHFAHSLRDQGAYQEALRYYRRTIQLWQDWGHRGAIAHQLECFAFISVASEQYVRAAKLFGAAESLREVTNSIRTPAEQNEFEEAKSRLQANMGEGEFNKAWEEGRSITMEQAIEFALEESK